jgi:citrate lyase beta subunit
MPHCANQKVPPASDSRPGVRELIAEQNRNFHHAKQALVVAAKAAGLPIDSAYLRLWRVDDAPERIAAVDAGLHAKSSGAVSLGMDGTWVIHRQQLEIANACYSPAPVQVAQARRLVKLYDAHGGSIEDPSSGQMIDATSIRRMLMDLAKGTQMGLLAEDELAHLVQRLEQIAGRDILSLMRAAG